jgi:hypothetical protein
VILSVGTKKGLFVAEAAKDRGGFALRGPFGAGAPVDATFIDRRGTPQIYVSSRNMFFGMTILVSTDLGRKFRETRAAPAFSKEDGRNLINVWALETGVAEGELWSGVEPAALFRSRDGGDSWEMVSAIDFDRLASPALYFGTTTGQPWMGRDGGANWSCLFHSLPPIHCLKAAVV